MSISPRLLQSSEKKIRYLLHTHCVYSIYSGGASSRKCKDKADRFSSLKRAISLSPVSRAASWWKIAKGIKNWLNLWSFLMEKCFSTFYQHHPTPISSFFYRTFFLPFASCLRAPLKNPLIQSTVSERTGRPTLSSRRKVVPDEKSILSTV